MAGEPIGVEIIGLRELRKAFRDAEAGTQHRLQVRLKEVAAQAASAIAGEVPTGPTGRAARSVRAVASQTSAGIVAGGPTAPYFPWLDFGGSTGRGHRPGVKDSGAVKRPWMGRGGGGGGEGRYVYPVVRAMQDQITEAASAAVHEALADAGWEP